MIADLAFPSLPTLDIHSGGVDAVLGLRAVKWIGLLVLVGFAYTRCYGWGPTDASSGHRPTLFGFRIGLILATFNALLVLIALGVFAASAPNSPYIGIPRILSAVLSAVTRGIMGYALLRIVLRPLRAAGAIRFDQRLAAMTVIVSAIASILYIATLTWHDSQQIARAANASYTLTDKSYSSEGEAFVDATRMFLTLSVADALVAALIGAVCLGAAVFALVKSKTIDLRSDQHRALKLMVGAGATWLAASIIAVAITAYQTAPIIQQQEWELRRIGQSLYSDWAPAMHAVDILTELTIWTLFVLCFRAGKERLPF